MGRFGYMIGWWIIQPVVTQIGLVHVDIMIHGHQKFAKLLYRICYVFKMINPMHPIFLISQSTNHIQFKYHPDPLSIFKIIPFEIKIYLVHYYPIYSLSPSQSVI